MSLTSLQNLCVYSLGPNLSEQTSSALETQITGMQDMTKNQVNQSIYIGTQSSIAKTEGALQNIDITQDFLGTTIASLEAVNEELLNASKAVMTLLNGVVSSTDKEAAVDSILNTTGMVENPSSRDMQEGSVVKALRQAGTGQSPFYTLTTQEGAPPTADAAPPEAPIGASSVPLYLNGTGSPAPDFLDATTVSFTGMDANFAGTIDPATATVTDTDPTDELTALTFSVQVGDVTFVSEHTDVTNGATGLMLNMYNPHDRSQYITFYTATTFAAADKAALEPSFKALFTGSVDTAAQTAGASGTWTWDSINTTQTANTFADQGGSPPGPGPAFSGVEPGAIQVLSATAKTAQFAVMVGAHVYSTSMNDTYDLTTSTAASSTITLYLNGDTANAQTITLTCADLSSTNGFTDNATTLQAFTEYMTGTYTAATGSTAEPGIFQHSGAASPTGAFMPCNAASFVGVDAGEISVESATFGAGTDSQISVKVGDATYATVTAGADVLAASGSVVLYLDGDDGTNPNNTITIRTGPIASAVGPPPVGVIDDATLLAEVEYALDGTFNAFGESASGGAAVTFSFNPGSNVGAGYFTVDYDGSHLTITDQFGTLMNSYPLDDRMVIDAAQTTGEVQVGTLGTVYVDSTYTGGGFSAQLTTTPTDAFSAIVTVSATDGTRLVEIPNITDQTLLWGDNTTIDRARLIVDTAYQQRVKGMIDHALEEIKDTMQYVSNLLAILNADEESQNATMESLQNLQDTVSKADPIESAVAVFDSSQQYLRMIQSMTIDCQIIAQEGAQSNQIAQLATSGF